MNNTFKTITTAIALTAGIFAQADPREVVRIQYNDGIVDYIPADDIARISFARGVDTGSELYTLVNERFDFLKEILTFYNGHFAIGYGGIMIGLDCMTEDMNVPDSGYNWFREWCIFNTQSPLYHPTGYMWAMMYSTIHGCNSIISNHAASSEESRLLLAQAHALRSWAYWNLVQMYAPNYHFAPQAPGIVILPENSGRDGTYPLSTVEDVYSAILADINLAIDNLKEISMDPAHINVTVAKRYINLGAAYGLRARYKLTMHRYADAAADASMAIEASSGRPLLPAAAAYPGFNDAKLGNWMWAITINPMHPPKIMFVILPRRSVRYSMEGTAISPCPNAAGKRSISILRRKAMMCAACGLPMNPVKTRTSLRPNRRLSICLTRLPVCHISTLNSTTIRGGWCIRFLHPISL